LGEGEGEGWMLGEVEHRKATLVVGLGLVVDHLGIGFVSWQLICVGRVFCLGDSCVWMHYTV
jgi:hypothetical protein